MAKNQFQFPKIAFALKAFSNQRKRMIDAF
jgi:hypothetical protein